MKTTAFLFGLLALAQAQTLKPSPTESVGCVSHGDHWDCDGPRVIHTGAVPAPTNDHHDDDHDDDDDHDHDDDHDDDHAFDHDDVDKHLHSTPIVSGATTRSLKPSPTESVGCEAHGDHWHCQAAVGVATTLTGSGFTSVITPAPTVGSGAAASASAATAGGARAQATGFAAAGLAVAAIAMAL